MKKERSDMMRNLSWIMDVLASVDVQDEINELLSMAEGINYARRLADTPSNLMTPEKWSRNPFNWLKIMVWNVPFLIRHS